MVDAAGNGKLIWSATLSDYAPSNTPGPTKSRTSPAVVNGVLYIGTQAGAYVLAINAATGALMWKTQVEDLDPHAVDAIVALDLASGAIKWATKLVYWNQLFVRDGSDDWNVDCFFPSPQNPGPQCPSDPGPVAGGTPLHASDRRTVRGRLVGECGSRGIERDRVLGIRLYKSWSPRDRQ